MDDQHTTHAYETPRVVDYGDLQELTADCYGVTGGDAAYSGSGYTSTIGPSNPPAHCTSSP